MIGSALNAVRGKASLVETPPPQPPPFFNLTKLRRETNRPESERSSEDGKINFNGLAILEKKGTSSQLEGLSILLKKGRKESSVLGSVLGRRPSTTSFSSSISSGDSFLNSESKILKSPVKRSEKGTGWNWLCRRSSLLGLPPPIPLSAASTSSKDTSAVYENESNVVINQTSVDSVMSPLTLNTAVPHAPPYEKMYPGAPRKVESLSQLSALYGSGLAGLAMLESKKSNQGTLDGLSVLLAKGLVRYSSSQNSSATTTTAATPTTTDSTGSPTTTAATPTTTYSIRSPVEHPSKTLSSSSTSKRVRCQPPGKGTSWIRRRSRRLGIPSPKQPLPVAVYPTTPLRPTGMSAKVIFKRKYERMNT